LPPPALLVADRTVLVLVDLQPRLLDIVHRPALVRESAARLLRLAGIFGVPVVLTEQYPEGLGPTDREIQAHFDDLTTPKAMVSKLSFGCCGDPGFRAALEQLAAGDAPRDQIVLAGIEAHVCVLQTAFELLRHGHDVHVCWDAVSGRGAEYRDHALRRMEAAGVQLSNHESVAFEWARSKDHSGFKELQQLLRKGQPV